VISFSSFHPIDAVQVAALAVLLVWCSIPSHRLWRIGIVLIAGKLVTVPPARNLVEVDGQRAGFSFPGRFRTLSLSAGAGPGPASPVSTSPVVLPQPDNHTSTLFVTLRSEGSPAWSHPGSRRAGVLAGVHGYIHGFSRIIRRLYKDFRIEYRSDCE